jgi:hypothetical protein
VELTHFSIKLDEGTFDHDVAWNASKLVSEREVFDRELYDARELDLRNEVISASVSEFVEKFAPAFQLDRDARHRWDSELERSLRYQSSLRMFRGRGNPAGRKLLIKMLLDTCEQLALPPPRASELTSLAVEAGVEKPYLPKHQRQQRQVWEKALREEIEARGGKRTPSMQRPSRQGRK